MVLGFELCFGGTGRRHQEISYRITVKIGGSPQKNSYMQAFKGALAWCHQGKKTQYPGDSIPCGPCDIWEFQ